MLPNSWRQHLQFSWRTFSKPSALSGSILRQSCVLSVFRSIQKGWSSPRWTGTGPSNYDRHQWPGLCCSLNPAACWWRLRTAACCSRAPTHSWCRSQTGLSQPRHCLCFWKGCYRSLGRIPPEPGTSWGPGPFWLRYFWFSSLWRTSWSSLGRGIGLMPLFAPSLRQRAGKESPPKLMSGVWRQRTLESALLWSALSASVTSGSPAGGCRGGGIPRFVGPCRSVYSQRSLFDHLTSKFGPPSAVIARRRSKLSYIGCLFIAGSRYLGLIGRHGKLSACRFS